MQHRRIGLVLGAGGTVGAAYHAGALYSLWHHTGWDARHAASIVGTSAGALVGALLRCDVSPEELVSLSREDRRRHLPDRLRELSDAAGTPPPGIREMFTAMRPPTLGATVRSVRARSIRPWLLSIPRSARYDLRPLFAGLDRLSPSWPTDDFRVCAVSATTGQRVTLDTTSGMALSAAVAASCAVPGLFAPQRYRGDSLYDGGVHSTTNIDALPLDRLDEVWVVAPMAGTTYRHVLTGGLWQRIRSSLAAELAVIPEDVPVRLVVPGDDAKDAFGIDLMRPDRGQAAVLAGFLEAGDATRS